VKQGTPGAVGATRVSRGGRRPDGMPPLVPAEATGADAGGAASLAWRALRQAAEATVALWRGTPAAEESAEDVREPLHLLCEAVGQASRGETPSLRGISPTVPARQLLERLRDQYLELLRDVEAHLEMGETLSLLHAMERVREAIDRDAAQRFASRLAGPDAMHLVVEVAHDMRSPLTSILFLAERLRKGQSGPVTAIQERQLGLVYSAAFGLSSLASDVIELARGGERLIDRHPMPFSVSSIFQSVRDIVQPIAEEKGLAIRVEPPDADMRVGYPAALNRVLLNLTTNALKFTHQGSVEVVATPKSRTRVEFAVKDTGRGIPPPVLATLFDAFRRRQKPGEYTFSSAGLGLSICQTLVTAMGGELLVETALERGTCFFFELDLPQATKL
jgi:signal transduction histidine kinase